MNKLLEIWPTVAALADDLSLPYPTVGSWVHRGIPAKRFGEIIVAARSRGADLTFEDLLAANQRPSTEKDVA